MKNPGVQSVKCLPHGYGDGISGPQLPHKSQVCDDTCLKSSTGEAETGGYLESTGQRLSMTSELQVHWETLSQEETVEKDRQHPYPPPLPTCTLMYPHTQSELYHDTLVGETHD